VLSRAAPCRAARQQTVAEPGHFSNERNLAFRRKHTRYAEVT